MSVLGYALVRSLPGFGLLILLLSGAIAVTTAVAHVLRSDAFPRVLLMPLAALAAASLTAMSANRLDEAQAAAKVRAKWQQRHAAMDVSRCPPPAVVNR
jgi:hypothetical protein